jgi:hypothetical protein
LYFRPVRSVRLEENELREPNSMAPRITRVPITAMANKIRWKEKYRRVPEATRTPASTRNSVPSQNTPCLPDTDVPQSVNVEFLAISPTVEKKDESPTCTIRPAA